MNRFINPHLQHSNMQNDNSRFNMNTNYNAPNVIMQQIMTPNGPMVVPMQQIMTPNGPMLVPIQQNMPNMGGMPMGGMYNANMMPTGPSGMMHMQSPMNTGMPNMINMNRFGTSASAINNNLSITSNENNYVGNRFQQNTEIMENQTSQQKETSEIFTINIERNIKFENNNKVTLNTYIEEVKPINIKHINESFCLLDCFEEAVECIIENANEEESKLITAQQFIVNNIIYKTVGQDRFNEFILNNDVKGIYKALKTAFPTLNNKYDINLINLFNNILTDYVNDFIKINASFDVYIDSFMTDFNDLLKVIRDNEEDLEDNLISYMNSVINSIKENISIVSNTPNYNNKNVYIPETYSLCYVDKLACELGINTAYNKFIRVDDNIANTFLISLSKNVFEKLNTNNFYLITIDRFIVRLMKNLSDKVFIKRIS